MKIARSLTTLTLLSVALIYMSGCAMMPGGIAASTTPIQGRKYTNLGNVSKTDSRIYLLGILPVSGANTTRDAIDSAVKSRHGDAMINVTVESYSQWWLLFSRFVTRIEGDVIRFEQ